MQDTSKSYLLHITVSPVWAAHPPTNIGRAFVLAGPIYIGDDITREPPTPYPPTSPEPINPPPMTEATTDDGGDDGRQASASSRDVSATGAFEPSFVS